MSWPSVLSTATGIFLVHEAESEAIRRRLCIAIVEECGSAEAVLIPVNDPDRRSQSAGCEVWVRVLLPVSGGGTERVTMVDMLDGTFRDVDGEGDNPEASTGVEGSPE
jgi:hypothetical protein